jgi:hypothetical protein
MNYSPDDERRALDKLAADLQATPADVWIDGRHRGWRIGHRLAYDGRFRHLTDNSLACGVCWDDYRFAVSADAIRCAKWLVDAEVMRELTECERAS